ncbi:MAG: aminoglycoside adenylyltransferase domain-containing protein [Chloroflexota bacterium]
MHPIEPTPYPELNKLLQVLLQNVRTVLGPHFVGMYLEGSLANEAFDEASDIDFIVVTDQDVTEDLFLTLRAMHDRIALLDSRWGFELEGSYVGRQALRRREEVPGPQADDAHVHPLYPNLERGVGEHLKMAPHDESWLVHRAILGERGITLAGPPPQTLVDPVTPTELRQAMLSVLREWPASLLEQPEKLGIWGLHTYVVVTLCRMLYTLHHGMVASKISAARWAQETLDKEWAPQIQRAWAWRYRPQPAASSEEVAETIAFIHYALQYSKDET